MNREKIGGKDSQNEFKIGGKCFLNKSKIGGECSLNKKGTVSVSILVLVILIIMLFGFTLFKFYTSSGKIDMQISDSIFVEAVRALEREVKFELSSAGGSALVEAYSNVLSGNFFLDMQSGSLDSDRVDALLKEKIIKNLNEQEIVKRYRTERQMGDLNVEKAGGYFEIEAENFFSSGTTSVEEKKQTFLWGFVPLLSEISSSMEIGVVVNRDLKTGVYYEQLEIYPLEKIYSESKECVRKNEIEAVKMCLSEKMPNFEFNVFNKSDKINSVKCASKNSFLIRGELKTIEFLFNFDDSGQFV